jgi:hypothetical protein
MKALKRMPMRAAVCVVLLIAGLAGGAGIAAAQEPTSDQQSAIRSNCRSDFMANCSGVPRGGKEALQCLKDNVAKLSSGCQQAVKAIMHRQMRSASCRSCPVRQNNGTLRQPVARKPVSSFARPARVRFLTCNRHRRTYNSSVETEACVEASAVFTSNRIFDQGLGDHLVQRQRQPHQGRRCLSAQHQYRHHDLLAVLEARHGCAMSAVQAKAGPACSPNRRDWRAERRPRAP